jgi:hypothetical protein
MEINRIITCIYLPIILGKKENRSGVKVSMGYNGAIDDVLRLLY